MSTKYMSVAEAAELLQVDRETVKNYVRRGVFVVSKRKNNMGGYQILRSSVDAFLSEGYDVAEQIREIEQLRVEVTKEKENLKEAKEKLAAQKEMMRIKGVMYENMLEFRGILVTLLDCLGDGPLSKREREICMDFLQGSHYDAICDKHELTRARILQIYHKALRRLKNSESYIINKRVNDDLRKIIADQESEINALRQTVKLHDVPLPTDSVLIPESLIGLKNYPLSVRARHILELIDVKNLYELAGLSSRELARCRNLGKKTLSELDMLMDRFNLEWGNVESLMKARNPYGDRLVDVKYATINAIKTRLW